VDEHVLHEVIGVGRRDAGDQHAVHGAREAAVELAEGVAIAIARLHDQPRMPGITRPWSHLWEDAPEARTVNGPAEPMNL
jgi:hypothetical protein